jgi:CRP/FNR family cyclic AMP-dependent transcriptional regulator
MLPARIVAHLPQSIIDESRFIEYSKGEVISRPNELVEYVHFIMRGLVKVYTINKRGEEFIQAVYGPSDIFTLTTVINGLQINSYYEALNNCTIRRVPVKEFIDALKSDTQFSFEVIQQIVAQLTVYKSRVDSLEYKYAQERLAHYILLFSYRFGERKEGKLVVPSLTQEDLGNTINLSRESVSKGLKRFVRLGFISHVDSHLIVSDVEGLIGQFADTTSLPLFVADIRKEQLEYDGIDD